MRFTSAAGPVISAFPASSNDERNQLHWQFITVGSMPRQISNVSCVIAVTCHLCDQACSHEHTYTDAVHTASAPICCIQY